MKIFLVLILFSAVILSGCVALTPSERLVWDTYFEQMEKAHQIDTGFLLENPNQY